MTTEFVIIRVKKKDTVDYVFGWTQDQGIRSTNNIQQSKLYTHKEADTIILVENQYCLDKIRVTIDL